MEKSSIKCGPMLPSMCTIRYTRQHGLTRNKYIPPRVYKPFELQCQYARELGMLVKIGSLRRVGTDGKGTFYELIGSQTAQMAHKGFRNGLIRQGTVKRKRRKEND